MASYDQDVARRIVDVGRQRGLGQREIIAALSTGLVESGLKNIRHGDRDSLGVFQQRPSQGWGTPDQITDVDYAAGKFFDAIDQFDKPGISGAELAARIQRPKAQYRDRYAQRWGEAEQIYQQLAGSGTQVNPGIQSSMSQFREDTGTGGPSLNPGIRSSMNTFREDAGVAPLEGDVFDSNEMWRTILTTLADSAAGGQREDIGEPEAEEATLTSTSTDMLNDTLSRWGTEGPSEDEIGDAEPIEGADAPEPPDADASELGNVTPGKDGVPAGLKTNAARGAAAARKILGFDGEIGGVGERANKSDHPNGNAIDIMTGGDVDRGQEIAEWYVRNRSKLGVKYVIFNRTIWSAKNDWKPRRMADRGSPTANHVDHPHISFS